MDFNFKLNVPKIDLPKQKDLKIYHTKSGERTLTPAQKRKLKEGVRFRCQKCNKKYEPRLLEIHHKKGVARHKINFDIGVFSQGKKHIPKYDRQKSNLEVVCYKCHDKTKKRKTGRTAKDFDISFRF